MWVLLPLALLRVLRIKCAMMMQVHAGRIPSIALDDWVERSESGTNVFGNPNR